MDSPQIRNFSNRTQGFESATSSGKTSPVKRIALVAVLAGFAFVAFATRNITPSDQSPAAHAGTTAVATPGAMHAMEIQLAPSTTEYYLPGQYVNQARSNDGNVMTYEHD